MKLKKRVKALERQVRRHEKLINGVLKTQIIEPAFNLAEDLHPKANKNTRYFINAEYAYRDVLARMLNKEFAKFLMCPPSWEESRCRWNKLANDSINDRELRDLPPAQARNRMRSRMDEHQFTSLINEDNNAGRMKDMLDNCADMAVRVAEAKEMFDEDS